MPFGPTVILTAIGLGMASCADGQTSSNVNRPIAQADVSDPVSWSVARERIKIFAAENHFAVQENLVRPRGMLDFNVRLFRDDISIVVDKVRNEPIHVAAYPLCACEMSQRPDIQPAADEAVAGLKRNLSGK